MLRCATVVLAFVLGLEAVGPSAFAYANPIAGAGWSSSYVGESDFGTTVAGASGAFAVTFFNDGTLPWAPGAVGLLICGADKITCGIASPNAAYSSGWYSKTVYATINQIVAPGSKGHFIYSYAVPAGTLPGTVTTFNGDVGLIASGALLRPEGYFHQNVVPQPRTLTISPTSASVPVGWTQQFSASTDVSWTVTGGCGAISSVGTFIALATNASSQPCAILAKAGSLSASAPLSVFGSPASLSCSATPTSVIADGTSATIVTIALVDANGTTVTNATSPSVTVVNVTPTLASLTPSGTLAPSAGTVSVTMTTTRTAGDMQLSAASSAGVTGCNKIVSSAAAGAGVKTAASLLTNPVSADGSSQSVVRVDIQDAAGNRALADNLSVITVSRDNAAVCSLGGAGSLSLTASSGRAEFAVSVGSTPGTCAITALVNNTSIAGTSVTLTATLAAPAATLGVARNDSPRTAGAAGSTMTVAVDVRDVTGNRVTGSTAVVSVALDTASCSGGPGGDVQVTPGMFVSAVQGRATFTLTSTGAYAACVLTFASQSLASSSTTVRFDPGTADHLSCSFFPTALLNDGLSRATLSVKVRDATNNLVSSGGPYSIVVTRTSGSGASLLVTPTPQQTSAGIATFTVLSTTTTGVDGFTASVSAKTVPTMPNPTSPSPCTLSVQTSIP